MGNTITSYKGFDKNLKCRDFQYEIGKEYEQDGEIRACKNGFHACESPLDVFAYYPPANNRFCVVEQSGTLSRDSDDSKVASSKIKIGAEIGIPGLIKAHMKYTKSRCTNENQGADFAALTGGNRSALTGGECSVLYGGENAKARGGMWSVLAFQVWEGIRIVGVKTAVVDGKAIKPNTWYTLQDGEIVEVPNHE